MNVWNFISFFWPHVLTVCGFILALIVVANVFRERRSPSVTLAWLLIILFIPYLGVPLYFIFGGRKNQRLVAHKKLRFREPTCANAPLKYGNKMELLPDGRLALKAILRAIEEAKVSIEIATYILGNDSVAEVILDALVKRAKEGIRVRLLIDALGSFWLRRKLLEPLLKAKGEVMKFVPVLPFQTETSANLRNHRKIMIFDHKYAIIGGQNLDARFLGPLNDSTAQSSKTFTDFSMSIQGPAIQDLERIFLMDWSFAAKKSLPNFELEAPDVPCEGTEWVQTLASGPDVEGDPLWERILSLIHSAQQEICLVTPYFVPDELLFRSLILKAKNGIRVKIFLPQKSNYWVMDLARQHYLRELKQAGAEIFLSTCPMLHAKLFIADRKIALIGSVNFDVRSLFVNFEVGMFIHETSGLNSQGQKSEAIRALLAWVDQLQLRCEAYKPNALSSSRKWVEDVAHMIAPLL